MSRHKKGNFQNSCSVCWHFIKAKKENKNEKKEKNNEEKGRKL